MTHQTHLFKTKQTLSLLLSDLSLLPLSEQFAIIIDLILLLQGINFIIIIINNIYLKKAI